ncbi:MAG: DNA mismatch repair protein MutS, partial [Byssovorax sp.]
METPVKKKLTPVMRQHEEAKASHPDALLFFRLGDFYELFGEDAVVAAKALSITLTSRNKSDPDEHPMCGVPYHAAHGYIAKLLALGHKVALCEQMADPSKVKGIVPRQVVRVVTPGLITDTEQLDARENHYLVAVDAGEGDSAGRDYGLALLDLSTGELSAARIERAAALLGEIARAAPREVIFAAGLEDVKAAAALSLPRAALRDDDALDGAALADLLDDAVEVPLAKAALADHPLLAVRAAARALRFARRCTPGQKIAVRRIIAHDPSSALRIDETAEVHLELARAVDGARQGSLLDVIDATVTPTGARLLKRRLLAPLLDVAAIRRRLDEVELFVTHARARAELREALAGIGDLERLSTR